MDDPISVKNDWDKVDWWALNRELVPRVARWFRDRKCYETDSILPNTGMSAIDVAHDAVVCIMESERYRTIPSHKVRLALAVTIAFRDFLDLVQSKEFNLGFMIDSVDPDEVEFLMPSVSPKDLLNAVEAESLIRSLGPDLDGDQEVMELLYIWLRLGINKRADIAGIMGVSERKVTDIARRMTYRLRKVRSLRRRLQSTDRSEI